MGADFFSTNKRRYRRNKKSAFVERKVLTERNKKTADVDFFVPPVLTLTGSEKSTWAKVATGGAKVCWQTHSHQMTVHHRRG